MADVKETENVTTVDLKYRGRIRADSDICRKAFPNVYLSE
jgi:hypothetical protein